MKKYLSAALSLILAILLVLSLSSCDKKNDKPSKSHIHRWGEWSTVKTSTCSEEGEAVRTAAMQRVPLPFSNQGSGGVPSW